jgi:hypothetical protein
LNLFVFSLGITAVSIVMIAIDFAIAIACWRWDTEESSISE